MDIKWRIRIVLLFFLLFTGLLSFRLFYWQVLKRDQLAQIAYGQYNVERKIPASRGEIISKDGFPLSANKLSYLLYASLEKIEQSPNKIAEKIAPVIFSEKLDIDLEASSSSDTAKLNLEKEKIIEELKEKGIQELEKILEERLSQKDIVWAALKHQLTPEQKDQVEKMDIKGLGFEEESSRFYPEASMSAHLLGFLGKDKEGQPVGYFGLEGFYDLEMRGRPGIINEEKDAVNQPILMGGFNTQEKIDGQDLKLHLDRSVQYIVSKYLKEGIEKYGAKSGSVVVMESKTGAVLAMSSIPRYDPNKYYQAEKGVFKNPVIAEAYEPGSIFKVLVMASALNEKLISPETKCPICDGPVEIDKYQIKTWNEEYHPNSTMTDVIVNSDNTGMVYVGQKLGIDRLYRYLEDFGLGEKTGIDLQEEVAAYMRPKKEWSKIDLATASFGQGIAVTRMQMINAVNAIASGGIIYEPQVVDAFDNGRESVDIQPSKLKRVISKKAAAQAKEMMVAAVEKGDSKWVNLKDYQVAGKTGTAQIPVSGHYDEEKTIASFVGFAPAYNPKFTMLVTLREPSSSPWGSETAAPLFFQIAQKLLHHYKIQPR